MNFDLFDHNDAANLISKKMQSEIQDAISSSTPKPLSTKKIRFLLISKLHDCGWSDGIRINPKSSKIDITSMKSNIGLCLQTGNMSRFYADLLKLQTLFAEGRINASFYVVPTKAFAKEIGDNLVNFERFVKELGIFKKTITVPILLYGIEN